MFGKTIITLLLLAPGALLAAASRPVEVVAQVPVVAEVESPADVLLAPGETRLVTVRVACNQPWLLAIRTGNPQIRTTSRQTGRAGGMEANGHSFTVSLTCSPEAVGPQRTALETRLISGMLVAGL